MILCELFIIFYHNIVLGMKQSLKPMSIVVEEIVFISVVHYQRSLYIQGFFSADREIIESLFMYTQVEF